MIGSPSSSSTHRSCGRFVAEVQAAIAAASSRQDACAAIEPRFVELLAYSGWLPDEYQAAAPESGMGGGRDHQAQDLADRTPGQAVPGGGERRAIQRRRWAVFVM